MRTVFFGSGDDWPQPPSDYRIPAPLGPEELRVLGCLIEKQFLTPDIYPLTINSMLAACNQKTSREPVTNYDEETIDATLVMLQGRGLCSRISGPEHRVPKFKELLSAKTNLRVSELGLLCVMMLRGPQTVNELKDRTSRIHAFGDAAEVEQALERMIHREPQPLVVLLPRQPGQKEVRYMHLLAGEVSFDPPAAASPAPLLTGATREDRIAKLEAEIADLRRAVDELVENFARFRGQFE